MNRLLTTDGNGFFFETTYSDELEPYDQDILVETVLTGICRSDIDMMQGYFELLPRSMHGHEGLGKVLKIGENVIDVEVGDIVSTRGEPAYADRYISKHREYVKVPSVDPKYILEPVACAINIVDYAKYELKKRQGHGKRLLILGSGFLAWIVHQTLSLYDLYYDVTIIGNHNHQLWGDLLEKDPTGDYDVVIDLSARLDVFQSNLLRNEALVIIGSQKTVTTDFSYFLWKACTAIFPSPRSENFYYCMSMAAEWIRLGELKTDGLWTRGYSRNTEWEKAFEESTTREPGFSRAYIDWRY